MVLHSGDYSFSFGGAMLHGVREMNSAGGSQESDKSPNLLLLKNGQELQYVGG